MKVLGQNSAKNWFHRFNNFIQENEHYAYKTVINPFYGFTDLSLLKEAPIEESWLSGRVSTYIFLSDVTNYNPYLNKNKSRRICIQRSSSFRFYLVLRNTSLLNIIFLHFVFVFTALSTLKETPTE